MRVKWYLSMCKRTIIDKNDFFTYCIFWDHGGDWWCWKSQKKFLDGVNSRKWRKYHNDGKFWGCTLFYSATHDSKLLIPQGWECVTVQWDPCELRSLSVLVKARFACAKDSKLFIQWDPCELRLISQRLSTLPQFSFPPSLNFISIRGNLPKYWHLLSFNLFKPMAVIGDLFQSCQIVSDHIGSSKIAKDPWLTTSWKWYFSLHYSPIRFVNHRRTERNFIFMSNERTSAKKSEAWQICKKIFLIPRSS